MNADKLNEPILSDDYPVYCGYWYVVDGAPARSNITGTVSDLKRQGAKEVRRCDAVKRDLPL